MDFRFFFYGSRKKFNQLAERAFAERSFVYTAPRLYNGLPATVKQQASVQSFKIHLKTFLFRGVAAGMSDHFLVEAEVVVAKEWGNRVVGCRREVVKVEELKKPEKKQEYQDKLKEAYDRVKEREA